MSALAYLQKEQQEFPPAYPWNELPDDLWKGLGPRIPLFITMMREEDRLAIGAISKDEPKIFIRYLENREYAILIHQDLFDWIYRLTRATISQLNVTFKGIEYPAAVESKRFAEIVTDVLWWFKQTGTIVGPQYPISQPHIHFAGTLTVEAENFLIAHELGHLILNPGYEPEPDDLVLRLLSGAYEGFIPSDIDRWEEEFRADIAGFRLVMGLSTGEVSKLGWQNQFRYAELMLLIQRALEILGFTVGSTHPPASKRLDILRQYARSTCKTDEEYRLLTSLAKMFEELFTEAISRLYDPKLDQDLYHDESEELIGKLDRSLWEFTEHATPAYASFYITMDGILAEGHYHVLLNRIVDYVRKLRPLSVEEMLSLELARSAGTSLSDEETQQLRGFHMYKLLLGYFMKRSDPIGRYVVQEISRPS